MTDEKVKHFKAFLQEAIDLRDTLLFPSNPLLEISQSIQDQENTKKEQAFLERIMNQFQKTFPEEEA